MLMARARIMILVRSEIVLSIIIDILARRVSGRGSVGLIRRVHRSRGFFAQESTSTLTVAWGKMRGPGSSVARGALPGRESTNKEEPQPRKR